MLTGVAIFLLIIIGLVAIPVSLNFDINWHNTFYNNIQLRWMFGLVRIQIPTQQTKPESVERQHKKSKRVASTRNRTPPIHKLILQKRFRQRVVQYMGDIWRSINKENLKIRVRAGLDDPADTGQLWAIVGPVSGVLASSQKASIDIQPDFINPGFELNASGLVGFSPLKILWISIGLMFSPAIWQGFQQVRAAR